MIEANNSWTGGVVLTLPVSKIRSVGGSSVCLHIDVEDALHLLHKLDIAIESSLEMITDDRAKYLRQLARARKSHDDRQVPEKA